MLTLKLTPYQVIKSCQEGVRLTSDKTNHTLILQI